MKIKTSQLIQFTILWVCLFAFFPNKNPEIQSLIPREGEIFHHLLVSPISFDIPKDPEKLIAERKLARDRVFPVFEYDEKGSESSRQLISDLQRKIRRYKYLTYRLQDSLSADTLASFKNKATNYYADLSKKISNSALETFINDPKLLGKASEVLNKILDKGISNYLVANSIEEVAEMRLSYQLKGVPVLRTPHSEVVLIKDGEELRIKKQFLKPLEARLEEEFSDLKKGDKYNLKEISAIYEFCSAYSITNLKYLTKETERRRNQEEKLILPSKGKVFKGMQIIGAGEIVNKDALEKIRALYKELKKDQSKLSKVLPIIGVALYTFIFSLLLFAFLTYLQKKSAHHKHNLKPLLLIPILQVVLFYSNSLIIESTQNILPNSSLNNADLTLAHPFIIASVLGVVLFDFRIALLLTVFSSFYFGAFTGFDLFYTLLSLFTGIAGIHFLKEIRYRSDFLKGWIISILIMITMIFAENLFKPNFDVEQITTEFILAALNITLAFSVCALLFIPLFEKFFHITTNLRLIELSDFNHPALKRISLLTPGTFNHSLMVGNLSEKAAEEINANPLLVRVMALYHDIGKSLHPEFFTENQKSGDSPHKNLSPEESAKIIISHVEGAYELAKEYKIPPTIIAGIPEHHGTGTIHYFYHKAKEIAGKDIPQSRFQYKGPKPQSKETAILMLADAIEATTRSLKDASPENLRSTVNKVINSRLFEGELNESGLNLTDLKKIELGFLKALEGMYHTRIKYPKGAFISTPQSPKD